MKVFPLSEINLLGNSLLAVKRLKLQRKDTAVISGTMSRWTALTTQHVYRHIQTLLLLTSPLVLIYSGPAKSTPVYVNAGSSLILNSGSGGGGGAD